MQSLDQRNPKFQRTLDAGMRHLMTLMSIYRWQSAQGRWFLHAYPHHNWSWNTKALQAAESVPGVQATTTKQVSNITKYRRPHLPRQFFEVCDEHWKKPLELFDAVLTIWAETHRHPMDLHEHAENPFVRARLVAQETKRVSELTPEDASSTFAAAPPLESLTFMLSRCMTGDRRVPADVKVLGFYDISRAHLLSQPSASHSCYQSTTYKSGYAFLDKDRYGTTDAATAMSFTQVRFRLIRVNLKCLCSDTATILWCEAQNHQKNQRSSVHTSHRQAPGDAKEVRIFKRIVRLLKLLYGAGRERIEHEADPRHTELIIYQLGLSCSWRSGSRGVEHRSLELITQVEKICNDAIVSRAGWT